MRPLKAYTYFMSSILLILCLMLSFSPSYSQAKDDNYGNTPDEMVPYGRFQDPYQLFFAEPYPFLGPGREKKAPEGLTSIKIGFLGPLEGSVEKDLGTQMLNGAQLALNEANKKGGYKGIPYELMIHNDVGLWGAAANEVVKMDDEKVWAILGSIDGTVTHVALRVALKVEIPMVNTGDTDPTLTETRIPWIIRIVGDDRQSSYALVNYIFKQQDHERVAVIRANSRYGRVGIGEFRDSARRIGFPIVLEVRYDDGETDFSVQLERIKKVSPDAVMVWGNAKEAGMIVNQFKEMGMNMPLFGSDRLATTEFLEIAGKNAEGIVTTNSYNPNLETEALQAFNRNYKEKYDKEPNTFAAHAYDGMNILIKSIEIAGLNRALIRDKLTDLKTFQGYQGITGEIILDPSWNDIGKIWMVKIKDGEFIYSPAPIRDIELTGRIAED